VRVNLAFLPRAEVSESQTFAQIQICFALNVGQSKFCILSAAHESLLRWIPLFGYMELTLPTPVSHPSFP